MSAASRYHAGPFYPPVAAMTPIVPLPNDAVSNIAYFIQLSVAPVFLLTGVGTMINVLTSRLGRIIDRARLKQERYEVCESDSLERLGLHRDLQRLSLRARLVSRAISLCTSCSLLVSVSIVVLFLEAQLHAYLHGVVPALFIAAMCAFIGGLLCFLREIQVATAALRIGPPTDGGS